MISRNTLISLLSLGFAAGASLAAPHYEHRFGTRVGDDIIYRVNGVPVYTEALEPTLHRRYRPSGLYSEWNRHQWEYTNFSRNPYQRYVSNTLEGNYFYDSFGSLVTRGWMIYDWRQVQPRIAESSHVYKASRYVNWFNRQILAFDSKGDYSFSIIVGDELNTTLTPLTFRKAGFNGVIGSLAANRYRLTGLFSRISGPVLINTTGTSDRRLNFTNLLAGRLELDLAPRLTVGLNLVNTHTTNGARQSFEGNPFKGNLATGQLNKPLQTVLVRLTDDSPEDGVSGAVLIGRDIEIAMKIPRVSDLDPSIMVERDTVIIGSVFGFDATSIQGGSVRNGLLTANGSEDIVLTYLLAPAEGTSEAGSLQLLLQRQLNLTLAEAENAISSIRNIRFRMVLANDYRVEMSSNRQTNNLGVPQFRLVTRADGNISNEVNAREVVFDYGLPTANLIYGVSTEVRDYHGFDFYGEINLNSQYRKYPNPNSDSHPAISGISGNRNALAWIANLSWKRTPWALFFEGFGMDDSYTTSVQPVTGSGILNYSPEATNLLYDFVDDNDDQDRHPDQLRSNQGSLVPPRVGEFVLERGGVPDPEVFPGYDENGDFISDFNQNDNPIRQSLLPDYDEAFLRYNSDRPEFLFGLDLNNNGWVDRFENDNLADYPYKKDHWGYNVYGSAQLGPSGKAVAGQLSQERRKTGQESNTRYTLLTLIRDIPGKGRLRLFDMTKLVKDNIPDHLFQWITQTPAMADPGESSGANVFTPDPLGAENTWVNTFYADWELSDFQHWRTFHRFKWETWRQRESNIEYLLDEKGNRLVNEGEPVVAWDPLGPHGRNGRRQSGFIGLIDKIEYRKRLGEFIVSPKAKSELLNQTAFDINIPKRQSWDLMLFLQFNFPLLRTTRIDAGLEQRFFYDLERKERNLDNGSLTGDFRGTVIAVQVTNPSNYLGYSLITQVGLRYDRRTLETVNHTRQKRASGTAFVSVFAGLN